MNDDPRQWIAAVCRESRETSKTNRTVVAAALNRSEDVIRRFETLRGGWSPHMAEIVAAYAQLAGVEPIELWREAITRWAASLAATPQDVEAAGPVGPRLDTARDAQSKPGSQRARASRRP